MRLHLLSKGLRKPNIVYDEKKWEKKRVLVSLDKNYSSIPQISDFKICEIPSKARDCIWKPPSSGVVARSADNFSSFRKIRSRNTSLSGEVLDFRVVTCSLILLGCYAKKLRKNRPREPAETTRKSWRHPHPRRGAPQLLSRILLPFDSIRHSTPTRKRRSSILFLNMGAILAPKTCHMANGASTLEQEFDVKWHYHSVTEVVKHEQKNIPNS